MTMNKKNFKTQLDGDRMQLLQKMADKENRQTNIFQFLHCVSLNGMGVLLSFGQWGGIYATSNGGGYRIGLGWLAITILPFDGDILMEVATHGFVREFMKKGKVRQSDSTISSSGLHDSSVSGDSVDKVDALLDEFFRKNKEKGEE